MNLINLSTPLGLVLARIGCAELSRGPEGLILATRYRASFPAPRAPAVAVGNVILLRMDAEQARSTTGLLQHEGRHATQYAFWLGPTGFLPAYLLASAWSWWRTRDFALRNPFEIHAGLIDGGYLARPTTADSDSSLPPQRGEGSLD